MATTTAHATSTPVGSDDVRNSARKKWSWWATTRPATTATNIASPAMVGVGRGWTFRSEGRSTALTLIASLRTRGVIRNATANVAPNTTRYGVRLTGRRSGRVGGSACRSDGVGREPGGQLRDASPRRLLDLVVVGRAQDVAHDAGDLLHLAFVHPQRRRARSAHPDSRRSHGGQRVERDRVLVQRDAHVVAGHLRIGPGDVERPEVDEREVGVGPPGDDPEALVGQPGGQRPGRPDDPVGVVGELRGHGLA